MGFSRRGPAGATGATGATGPQGPAGAPGATGTFDTSFQGAWSAGTYTVGETVSHGGFLWVCTAASTTQEPTGSPSDWSKLANSTLSGDLLVVDESGYWTSPLPGVHVTLKGAPATAGSAYAGSFRIEGGGGLANGSGGYTYGAVVSIQGGTGGSSTTTGGGKGGDAVVQAGNGGNVTGAFIAGNGGHGGVFGATGGSASGAGAEAGAGGNVNITAGNAGSAASGATPANGGNVNIDAGAKSSGSAADDGSISIGSSKGKAVNIAKSDALLGFHGATAVAKQTVSGARNNPEAALADLLTKLANLGLITNSTTAS